MLSFHELMRGFRSLELGPDAPVLVHTSVKAFGEIRGGVDTLLGALLAVQPHVLAPTHTYKPMIIPEEGPANNGIQYGSGKTQNALAEFFTPDMPADPLMGIFPEKLRLLEQAKRGAHPLLSFAGVGVDDLLVMQTVFEPLAPIRKMVEKNGWVLLMGVNHTINTSLHYAEKLAGRKQFVRWALTTQGVVECPGFPGCSLGFEQAAPYLADLARSVTLGEAEVRAFPLAPMLDVVVGLVKENPLALLCDDRECERCSAVRDVVLAAE
jgi:aminoglycoside 3-N-acetyltransferase